MNPPVEGQLWGKGKARWYGEALLYSDYGDKVCEVILPIVRGCSSLLDVGAGCGALVASRSRARSTV